MADTRETERDIRTEQALGELGGEPSKSPVEAAGGVYGAEGDPWVYKVGDDGSVMVKNTEGPGDWLPAPKAAEATIAAQIKSGQLTEGGGRAAAPVPEPEEWKDGFLASSGDDPYAMFRNQAAKKALEGA